MAQKDIEDIAIYMKQIDESKKADQEAYDESCKECNELQLKEDDEFEDEIIDKSQLGFIDDSDIDDAEQISNKADQTNEINPLDEDVSDCIAVDDEIDESENQGSITVEVYNEDDYGIHFAEEVVRHVPTVTATTAKHKLQNGDLEVTISGDVEDLKKAYAFYLGKENYSQVSDEDKEIFDSLLKYANGDTIAEADYREAVAHCLDPIGVEASTANLADQDTCAISFIKEEKAKRLAKKFLKCLKENDLSSLSDDELNKLDQIKDAADAGKFDDQSLENNKVWQSMLKQMGITQKEWDEMTPDQKKRAWNNCEENQPLPKGQFGDGIHTAIDPKTGKKYRYREQFIVFDPKTGETHVTAFNPNYSGDESIHQHPSKFYRNMKKQGEIEDQLNKEKTAKDAMKNARGKDTWDVQDFYNMIAPLDGKQRKQLMKELIDDIEKDHPNDPKAAGNEIMFVKELFNQKLTLRDFAKAWGASFPGVMKYHDKIIAIWKDTIREFGIEPDAPGGRAKFMRLIHNPVTFEKFKEKIKQNLDKRKKGHIVKGGM